MGRRTGQALFDLAKQLVDDGAVPGCELALFSHGDLRSFAYGRFSNHQSPQVTTDTVYDVASVSKLFTTALILRLHEAGKLSIFDQCANYLDNFQASEVRIVDLLTHRVDFNLSLADMRRDYPTSEALWRAIAQLPAPPKPTVGIHYANLPFIYLGMIIEQVSEQSLWSAMSNFFQALGLRETYTGADIDFLHIATPPTEIVGNKVVQGVTHDETARLSEYGIAGNAGVFSTANDLVKFGCAWLDGKVVTPETLAKLVFHNYDATNKNPQAWGWWLRLPPHDNGMPTPDIYSHSGFTGSFIAVNPSNGNACAFVCNRTYYGRGNRRHWRIWQPLVTWLQA
jgi:CubicO group peptidase (beta-lactamase class C family)